MANCDRSRDGSWTNNQRATRPLSRLVLVAVVLFFTLVLPSRAIALPIGVLSFDTLLPGPDGVNAFNIANLTEAFGLPPDFPVLDPVTLLGASLDLTYEDGSTATINLLNLTPGFADDPSLFVPDTLLFSSATFTATLSSLVLALADGSSFLASSNAISVALSPSAGLVLAPGDFAVIDIAGEIQSVPIPEPSALLLLASGLAASRTFRRRKMLRP